MAVAPDGRIAHVWLDHRQLAAAQSASVTHHHHQGGTGMGEGTDGVAMAQLSQLYFGMAGDPRPPRSLTGGVCFCCKTAVVSGPMARSPLRGGTCTRATCVTLPS